MASGGVEYRVLIGGQNADQALYDMIDTITIDQGIDLASEARVVLEMCADDRGSWHGLSEGYASSWRRIRIELRNGTQTWVPLIDGPIVKRSSEASSEPGTSVLTLVVRDDSIYLNHHAGVEVFEEQRDEDIARRLLVTPPIASAEVDAMIPRTPDRPLQFVRWGTPMDALRILAEPNDMHVYVRPGDTAGASIGCLKRIDTTKPATLPTLVLLGPKRNIESFHIDDDVGDASLQVAGSLTIDDLTVGHQTSSWQDNQLLDEESAADVIPNLGRTLLSPMMAAFYAVKELVAAQQQRNSFTIAATGMVRGGCYRGILTPFDVVNVSGADQKNCTKYVIKEVTHSLGRSEYTQQFTLFTNAVAAPGAGAIVPSEVAL